MNALVKELLSLRSDGASPNHSEVAKWCIQKHSSAQQRQGLDILVELFSLTAKQCYNNALKTHLPKFPPEQDVKRKNKASLSRPEPSHWWNELLWARWSFSVLCLLCKIHKTRLHHFKTLTQPEIRYVPYWPKNCIHSWPNSAFQLHMHVFRYN